MTWTQSLIPPDQPIEEQVRQLRERVIDLEQLVEKMADAMQSVAGFVMVNAIDQFNTETGRT